MAISQLRILNLAILTLESDLEKAGEEIRTLDKAVAFFSDENSDFQNLDSATHIEEYSIPKAEARYREIENELIDARYQLSLEIDKIYEI